MAETYRLAVLINQCRPAIHHARLDAALLYAGNLLLKLLRNPTVIGIQGSNVLPARLLYRSIPGGADSRIALPEELKSGIPSYKFLDDGTRGI